MKIVVIGMDYGGLSNDILLAQNNEVIAVDIVAEKINMINNKISPIKDRNIEYFLSNKNLNLKATADASNDYIDEEFIIIAVPTNYDSDNNYFDTHMIEDIIEAILNINPYASIIIKSIIPVGYTEKIRVIYETNNIILSPEFLREGKELYDNLYPSRIKVGDSTSKAKKLEEAIKLFSNSYLAIKVAYFNELDTYA